MIALEQIGGRLQRGREAALGVVQGRWRRFPGVAAPAPMFGDDDSGAVGAPEPASAGQCGTTLLPAQPSSVA